MHSEDQENLEEELDVQVEASAAERRSSSDLWLISYADFMTILLIFFLSMYGYTYLARATLARQQQVTYSEFAQLMFEMKENLGPDVEILDELERITIKLRDKVLFKSGESNLGPGARSTLAELAESLKLVEGHIIVQGHTDNVPIKSGPYRSNWELSAARSFSVIKDLTAHGVDPKRLAGWGFGENRPIQNNMTVENRFENRRIEVVLLKNKGA